MQTSVPYLLLEFTVAGNGFCTLPPVCTHAFLPSLIHTGIPAGAHRPWRHSPSSPHPGYTVALLGTMSPTSHRLAHVPPASLPLAEFSLWVPPTPLWLIHSFLPE